MYCLYDGPISQYVAESIKHESPMIFDDISHFKELCEQGLVDYGITSILVNNGNNLNYRVLSPEQLEVSESDEIQGLDVLVGKQWIIFSLNTI